MKAALSILLLLLAAVPLPAQCLLHVRVMGYQSGMPVSGVEVSSGASSDISDAQGLVQLRFEHKLPGDYASLLVQDRKGVMLVVNQKELDMLVIPARQEDTTVIFMTKPSSYARAIRRYYELRSSDIAGRLQAEADSLLFLLGTTKDEEEKRILKNKIAEIRKAESSFPDAKNPPAQLNTSLHPDSLYPSLRTGLDSANRAMQTVLEAYELKASLLWDDCRFQQAAGCWGKAAKIREEHLPGDRFGQAKACIMQGFCYHLINQPDSAQDCFRRAKALQREGDASPLTACMQLLNQACVDSLRRDRLIREIEQSNMD